MPYVYDYDTAADFLHTRDKPVPRKKIANNTYLERRDEDTIAVRLHNTDIVTYTPLTITLDTGGWLTVTTKARINDYLPAGWGVWSDKGTWSLVKRSAEFTPLSWRYTDGITLKRLSEMTWYVDQGTTLPTTQQEQDDAHNKAVKRLIGQYLKNLPSHDEACATDDLTPCTLCMGQWYPLANTQRLQYVSWGDAMGDTQHLIDHMVEGTYPPALYMAAVTQRGYQQAVLGHSSIVKRCLRAYLSARLFRGATAPVHGRHPVAV